MLEYLDKPDETETTIIEYEGKLWLLTGDIGFMSQDGTIEIRDRKKQLIKCKGYSVFPKEVEELEIVIDYAKRIRNVRNNLKLNQDQFAQKLNEKPSLLRRIEAGKVEPTIKLAKKIQEVYKIKLLKKVDETEFSVQKTKFMKKSTGSSLGDIAFIKKKK
ncbi:hypothetical protein ES703_113317 [subsurface metagenome]